MPHWVLFYHIVWATKYRQPLITQANETLIHTTIHEVSQHLRSTILCMNGPHDHIHVAVSIPPSLSVADWVGKVKGESAFVVNGAYPGLEPHFQWQQGYSAHTFGPQGKAFVLEYITRQKERHEQGDTLPSLEYVLDVDKRRRDKS